jgi:transketolase
MAGLFLKTAINVPAHWVPKKIEVGKQIAVGKGNRAEKFFMFAGWSPYDFDLKDEEFEKIKADAKAAKKEEDYEMSVVARDVKKLRKAAKDSKLSVGEKKKIAIEQKAKRSAAGKKGAATRAANKKARNIALYEEAQRLAKLKRKK